MKDLLNIFPFLHSGYKGQVYLHLGPANSGKSSSVEQYLSNRNPKLYYGTLLPSSNDRWEKIKIHRERRVGNAWFLLETTGDCEKDINDIFLFMEANEVPIHVMIDGVTSWCLSYDYSWDKAVCNARMIAEFLVNIVREQKSLSLHVLNTTYESDQLVSKMNKTINMILSSTFHEGLGGLSAYDHVDR